MAARSGDRGDFALPHGRVTLRQMDGKQVAFAKGKLLKYLPRPEVRPKRYLLTGNACPEPLELGGGKNRVVRGVPQMKVELVYDQTRYPQPWARGPYSPQLYADEFWLTSDALIKLNGTDLDRFETTVCAMPRGRFGVVMLVCAVGELQPDAGCAMEVPDGDGAESSQERGDLW